jgi:hypothetical protein
METVPNREKPMLLGKGTLLVSCPRNRQLMLAETMACRKAGTWSDGVEVVPPSNVNFRAQSSLIREGPLPPPVVRRCLGGVAAIAWLAPLVGNEVIQKQRTGRVVQVEAAGLERGPAGETAARQWRDRFCARLAPSTLRTTKERTGKPDINNADH